MRGSATGKAYVQGRALHPYAEQDVDWMVDEMKLAPDSKQSAASIGVGPFYLQLVRLSGVLQHKDIGR